MTFKKNRNFTEKQTHKFNVMMKFFFLSFREKLQAALQKFTDSRLRLEKLHLSGRRRQSISGRRTKRLKKDFSKMQKIVLVVLLSVLAGCLARPAAQEDNTSCKLNCATFMCM